MPQLRILHFIIEPIDTFQAVFTLISFNKEALGSFPPHCFDYWGVIKLMYYPKMGLIAFVASMA